MPEQIQKKKTQEKIEKQKLLLVEGQDEVNLFTELLADIQLEKDIQVISIGGKDKFEHQLAGLMKSSDFSIVDSIGIVRDADDNPKGAFDSVCSVLEGLKLPKPSTPLNTTAGCPQITVMIVPDSNSRGMIENICLESVKDDPAMKCVDQFFQCLETLQPQQKMQNIHKARVHAFLASREWMEIAHFECLQFCQNARSIPTSPASIVPKITAFLASRYTPSLNLGLAAKKVEQGDRYWQFEHSAFDLVKKFLRML